MSITNDSFLRQPHDKARKANIRPRTGTSKRNVWSGAKRCVTPRQTCPQPKGFGRNLRSKTRWFTGFCNSHQVSHFATFFIDARAGISVAESRLCFRMTPLPANEQRTYNSVLISLAHSAPGGLFRRPVNTPEGTPTWGSQTGDHMPTSLAQCFYMLTGDSAIAEDSTMILPQVHLRKPCYDFSFL